MKHTKTFDKERVALNLARLKKGGEVFEVVIDPDKVIQYKTKGNVQVKEVLKYARVFADAKKGYEASQEYMESLFSTSDPVKVAKIILDEGEIQFTQAYREQKRAEKKKRIVDIITRNAIDPRTNLPHPRARIESAMEEARVRIDNFKDASDQVQDIVKVLKPILPIKVGLREVLLKVPPEYGAKAYPLVERYGNIKQDTWQNDGSWVCTVEIAAGLQNEFFEKLNNLTKGEVETKVKK